jgi:hypothetical protein
MLFVGCGCMGGTSTGSSSAGATATASTFGSPPAAVQAQLIAADAHIVAG